MNKRTHEIFTQSSKQHALSKEKKSSKRLITLTNHVVNDSVLGNQELEVEPTPTKVQVQLRTEPIKRITRSSTKNKQKNSNPKKEYDTLVDLDPLEVELKCNRS